MVQLVSTPACHAGGRGFEPLLSRFSSGDSLYAMAQWKSPALVREGPVGSSSLPSAVYMCANGSEVEHRLAKARAAGSNPVSRLLFRRVPMGEPVFLSILCQSFFWMLFRQFPVAHFPAEHFREIWIRLLMKMYNYSIMT